MRTALGSGTLILLVVAALITAVNVPGEPQSPATRAATKTSPGQAAQSLEANASAGKRKIPCKTQENASLCYWTHGRLGIYNGNPSDRIWKVGTRRILGVFNGPSHFPPRSDDDFESPELPANLERAYKADYQSWKRSKEDLPHAFPVIFADFEVCRLEQEKKGEMQAVCVESAQSISVQK
jgi:hypothetical protein